MLIPIYNHHIIDYKITIIGAGAVSKFRNPRTNFEIFKKKFGTPPAPQNNPILTGKWGNFKK